MTRPPAPDVCCAAAGPLESIPGPVALIVVMACIIALLAFTAVVFSRGGHLDDHRHGRTDEQQDRAHQRRAGLLIFEEDDLPAYLVKDTRPDAGDQHGGGAQ